MRWVRHVGEQKCTQGFGAGALPEGKKPLENLGKDEVILQWIFNEVGWESVGRIHLAQDMDRQQALVSTAMNLRVP
jgi:hypothetical protein